MAQLLRRHCICFFSDNAFHMLVRVGSWEIFPHQQYCIRIFVDLVYRIASTFQPYNLRILNQRYVPRLWLVAGLVGGNVRDLVTPQLHSWPLRRCIRFLDQSKSSTSGSLHCAAKSPAKTRSLLPAKTDPIFPCNRPRFLTARKQQKKAGTIKPNQKTRPLNQPAT